MASSEHETVFGPDRAVRVRAVIAECIRRRSAGEPLADDELISSHSELMPELEDALRKLALIERARQDAASHGPGAGECESAILRDQLPGYEILREIHRGGQGVVYQAVQKSTRRKVAIKVLLEGPFADARARARLEREIHILAQLNHPNIVRVHDSGVAGGCAYYVMEYISGEALDAYLKRAAPPLRARVELFLKICDALGSAHLRGVIHRDLKPGNVRMDERGEPHILDFGLARVALAGGSDESAIEMMTVTGQFLGSLPWASPEQAAGRPDSLDLRTDVYSLGVLLFQMLTLRFPYPVSGPMPEVIQTICNTPPTRPRSLDRAIDEDLETICLKCLEKSRERRYQSAGELARDVRLYLAGQPIEARRASALYVLSKSLRRYRALASVVAGFLVLVIVFAAIMTGLYRAAQRSAHRAALVGGLLHDVLVSVDPEFARGVDQTLMLRVMEKADESVTAYTDEPEVVASLRGTLGETYIALGQYAEAARQLQAAVDALAATAADPEQLAALLYNLGWARKELEQFPAARAAYDRALALLEAEFGPGTLPTAEPINGIGQLLAAQRQPEAETWLRRALEIRQQHDAPARELAASAANLGSWLRDAGQLDEAEVLLNQAVALRRAALGPAHGDTLNSMNKLGLLYRDQNRLAEARALFEPLLEERRRTLGPRHPHVAATLNNLGLVCYAEEDYPEAIRCFREALDIMRAARGPEHTTTVEIALNLVAGQERAGELTAAEHNVSELYHVVTPDSPEYAKLLLMDARVHLAHGDAGAARTLLVESQRILDANPGAPARLRAGVADALSRCPPPSHEPASGTDAPPQDD